jgi:hypothetical protein
MLTNRNQLVFIVFVLCLELGLKVAEERALHRLLRCRFAQRSGRKLHISQTLTACELAAKALFVEQTAVSCFVHKLSLFEGLVRAATV